MTWWITELSSDTFKRPATLLRAAAGEDAAERTHLQLLLHLGEFALDGTPLTLVRLGGGGAAAAL